MTSLEFLDLSTYDLSMSWNFANLLNSISSLQEIHLVDCGIQNMHVSSYELNFSTLSNLKVLDLSHNSFEDNLPSVLTNLTSLRVLDLTDCGLNSTVPVMPNLLELDLSYNNFQHIEQFGFWRQCHLKILRVIFNSFYIRMNDSPTTNISECSQYALERLNFDLSLTGSIPESLGRLTNLRVLDLSHSELTSRIPKSLVRLKLLEVLDISYSFLNGSMPESLGRLDALKHLVLSNNYLTGPIPTSLGRLVSLQSFLVSSNRLEGVVSESLFKKLSMLKYLDLAYNNKLTFNVSREWMPPFQLTRVDLSSYNIADEFPLWLLTQRKLESLVMSNNSILGPLPTWLRKMHIIPYLDLSHNNLSGPLTNLPIGGTNDVFVDISYELNMQNNLFNVSIPLPLCKRTNLEYFNLSKNRLTGKIPTCPGKLQILKSMMFSSNRLSGVIPSSIAPHSSSLEWLHLNDNNFGGDGEFRRSNYL